jgi:HK97 family phage prohead protease/HK97 family phage major capsid protein
MNIQRFRLSLPQTFAIGNKQSDGLVIEGYAVHYDKAFPAQRFPKYIIDRGAISQAVIDTYLKKPLLLWSHDMDDLPLGPVLALSNRGDGLWMRGLIRNVGKGAELIPHIEDGTVSSLSIGFVMGEPDYDEETQTYRVTEVKELFDISVVNLGRDDEAGFEPIKSGNLTHAAGSHASAVYLQRSHTMSEINQDLLAEVKQELSKEQAVTMANINKENVEKIAKLENQVKAFGDESKRTSVELKEFTEKIGTQFTKAVEALNEDRKTAMLNMSGGATLHEIPLSLEQVMNIPGGAARRLFSKNVCDDIEQAQLWSDNVHLIDMALCAKDPTRKMIPIQDRISQMKAGKFLNRLVKRFAMDTATSAEGSQYVPTGYSNRLIEMIGMASLVDNLFEKWTMLEASCYKPVEGADILATRFAQKTAYISAFDSTEQTPGSANVAYVAEMLRTRVQISGEMTDDSMIPIIPYVMDKSAKGQARALDKWDLSGDDAAGTSFDSGDVPGATDCRYCGNGLRQIAAARSGTLDMSTVDTDTFIKLWALMGTYGQNPGDLAIICSLGTYLRKFMNFRDSDGHSVVTTVDKIGSGATILNGQIGSVYGIPIIPSEWILQTFAPTGYYTGSGQTHSIIVLVNRRAFSRGIWKQPSPEIIRDGINNVYDVVTWFRSDFQCDFAASFPSASDIPVVFGYGVTTV